MKDKNTKLNQSNVNSEVSDPQGGHMTDGSSSNNVFYKKTKLQILAETLEDEPRSPSSGKILFCI